MLLTTISKADCIDRQDLERENEIYESTLCTWVAAGAGVCFGDSGSALVANNRLIGITSWGESCAIGNTDQFMRISYFYNWIIEHVHSFD